MIRTLILDAGGVLVYPVRGDWTVPFTLPFEPDLRWKEAWANAAEYLREDIVLDISGEYENRLRFLRSMDEQLGWHFSEDELRALAQDFTHNPARYGWYGDVQPMLAVFGQKYRLGMLTDAMPSFPGFVREKGLDKYFEAIVASTEVGACKPDPRMYNEICRRMEIDPSECLFVDDRPCNLEGAMAVGMRAVQMCRQARQSNFQFDLSASGLKAGLKTQRVSNLAELKPWNGPFVRDLSELNAYLEELH